MSHLIVCFTLSLSPLKLVMSELQTGSFGLYKGGEELRRAVAALAGPSGEHREVCQILHAL